MPVSEPLPPPTTPRKQKHTAAPFCFLKVHIQQVLDQHHSNICICGWNLFKEMSEIEALNINSLVEQLGGMCGREHWPSSGLCFSEGGNAPLRYLASGLFLQMWLWGAASAYSYSLPRPTGGRTGQWVKVDLMEKVLSMQLTQNHHS